MTWCGITPASLFTTVTFLIARALQFSSNRTSCNLVILSVLKESGFKPHIELICTDPDSPGMPSFSKCFSKTGSTMYCTPPITIRYKSTKNIASISFDGSSISTQLIGECFTITKDKCTRTFHHFFGEIPEIPRRLNVTSLNLPRAKNISSISVANCTSADPRKGFCTSDNVTNIGSLLDRLKKYFRDNDHQIVTGIIIISKNLALQCEINSFEPSITKHLTFNSSLEGVVSYNFFSSIPKVQDIYIKDLNLSQTPSDLFVQNSLLRKCVIEQSMLEDVHPELFTSAVGLEDVDLSNNRLQTLPEDLFQNNIHLRQLLLAGNQIRFLPTKFLERCSNLSVLDLSYNPLHTLQLSLMSNPPETTYANFTLARPVPKTFRERYRSWLANPTRLAEIANATIRSNALGMIDLRYSQLEKIPDGVLDGSIILTIFRVDHSAKLKSLNGSHSFYALQEFSASNCSITSVDEDFFAKGDDNKPLFVKKIDLSKNKIGVLHRRTFWNCNELEFLSLNRNRLLKLQNGLFKDLENLRELNVSENFIFRFQPEALRLRNIIHLDFSWNHISAFEPKEMISLLEESRFGLLKAIDLSHNCLTTKKVILPSVNDTRRLYLKYMFLTPET